MKKATQISTVLSWINLIIGIILVVAGLMMATVSPSILTIITSVVLAGSIVLHSYAALQLRKSIVDRSIPLNTNTPTGIRFMGYMALFFALLNIGNATVILQNTAAFVQQVKLPDEAKNLNVNKLLKGAGIFTLLFSLCIAANVILNFRLLKWYLLTNADEKNGLE